MFVFLERQFNENKFQMKMIYIQYRYIDTLEKTSYLWLGIRVFFNCQFSH